MTNGLPKGEQIVADRMERDAQRLLKCQQEIEAVLDKHRCELSFEIVDGRVVIRMTVLRDSEEN